jgi:hypothetical protein
MPQLPNFHSGVRRGTGHDPTRGANVNLMADYLLVVSDREPLAWILTARMMAFPANRSGDAGRLVPGDRLFLYTTRACFRSPVRDRGRVIGEAEVTSLVTTLDIPVDFGGRTFPLGCSLRVASLAKRGSGPELAELVSQLHLFPKPESWSMRLRRVLIPLDAHDANLLHGRLKRVAGPPSEAIGEYVARTGFAEFAGL